MILEIASNDFKDNEFMLIKNTCFGDNISPCFQLKNLDKAAKSIAITLDDLDIPFGKPLNHWLAWNILPQESIPSYRGKDIQGVVQGIGYGKNEYRGPNQPFFIRKAHRYLFTIYTLDTTLDIPISSTKKDLLIAINGHILQEGTITGKYQRKLNKDKQSK